MQEAKKNGKGLAVLRTILGGAEVSVLFFPVVFMTVPLYRFFDREETMLLISMATVVPAALLGFVVMLDRSARQALLKWIASIPFSAVFWLYFFYNDFEERMYDFIGSSYWSGWVDSYMGAIPVLGTALAAGGLGVVAAMLVSRYKPTEKLRRFALFMQKTVCPAVCGIIFIAVVILGIIMPDFNPMSD